MGADPRSSDAAGSTIWRSGCTSVERRQAEAAPAAPSKAEAEFNEREFLILWQARYGFITGHGPIDGVSNNDPHLAI
ncbi:hypothetical protein ABIE49_001161 [Bradyrhizobium sp. OAE829]